MSDSLPPEQTPTTPAEYERVWDGWLTQQIDVGMQYLRTVPDRLLSPEELQDVIASCDQLQQTFSQGVAAAAYLTQSGLPGFAQRLAGASGDLRTATTRYYETLDTAVRERAKQQGIVVASTRDATLQWLDTTRHSAAVFQRSLQSIEDAKNECCFVCHKYIGVPGGGYCAEHARERGL